MNALRQLWLRLVPAAQDAIQATRLEQPENADLAPVRRALATSIDDMRSLFANIGEDEAAIGLYPFNDLKGIYDEIPRLQAGENAEAVRTRIVRHWKSLRSLAAGV